MLQSSACIISTWIHNPNGVLRKSFESLLLDKESIVSPIGFEKQPETVLSNTVWTLCSFFETGKLNHFQVILHCAIVLCVHVPIVSHVQLFSTEWRMVCLYPLWSEFCFVVSHKHKLTKSTYCWHINIF